VNCRSTREKRVVPPNDMLRLFTVIIAVAPFQRKYGKVIAAAIIISLLRRVATNIFVP